jgi:hypothetical protein
LGDVPDGAARRLLAPLLQSRLLAACGLEAGSVRYRSLEPVREVVERELGEAERADRTARAMARLRSVADAVGGLDHRITESALPAAEAELANVRHVMSTAKGTEQALALAVAMAGPMAEIGLGAEGAEWIDHHLDAAPEADPLLRARAILASVTVHGFFAGAMVSIDDLEAAAALALDGGDERLRVALSGRVALAKAWAGDLDGASAIADDPAAADIVRSLGDPWLELQLVRLRAMLQAFRGDLSGALAALRTITTRFHALGDASGIITTLYLRAYLARLAGDSETSRSELLLARELCFTGASRATQALVEAELAQHARSRGDRAAVAQMTEAAGALERAGNFRAAAVARRDAGRWRLADGDADGIDDVRAALPTLLRVDRQAAGPALAELARTAAASDARTGALLAGAAAQVLRTAAGTPLAPAEAARVKAMLRELSEAHPPAAVEGAALDDAAILSVALAAASA